MTTYQATPDVYEDDLRNVVQVIDEIKLALNRCEDVYLEEADLILWNKNDYPMGRLHMDDGQWVFTPHNESNVEGEAS